MRTIVLQLALFRKWLTKMHLRKKVLRRNDSSFMIKEFRNAIYTRSKLEIIFKKIQPQIMIVFMTGKEIDVISSEGNLFAIISLILLIKEYLTKKIFGKL